MQWVQLVLDFIVELKWPALVVYLFWRFRTQMPALIERIRSFELPGGVKATLAEPLKTLDQAALALADDVGEIQSEARSLVPVPVMGTISALPRDGRGTDDADASSDAESPLSGQAEDETYAIERQVLEAARTSPEVALMLLATEIERALRQVIASRGSRGDLERGSRRPTTPRFLMQTLIQRDDLPKSLAVSMDAFWNVRNLVVHGRHANREEILQAIDSGLTILRSINAIPHEVYTVREPRVELFSDAAGTEPRPNVWGVMLEFTSPGGVMKVVQVFPTTTVYTKGKRVSLEWREPVWGETWYRNPDNGQIEHGWGAIAEFAGRHIDEIC